MIRSSRYTKVLQEAIITQRNGRYVVPVRADQQQAVPGLVHDTSASGATVFIEPMAVVEANNAIKVLESEEQEEIRRILIALTNGVAEVSQELAQSYNTAVQLDIIFAKAQLAVDMKASVPVLNQDGIIDLKKARHPLIDSKKIVPIDIRLGSDYDTLVITGPNTGGKTVSIKTLGLLTLMAMCGLMIPAADQSQISIFTHVLADIGDEQSIEQSLSTFSSHMTNIISILEIANENSLVLIDELGAGTDPVEGAALAIAILEALHNKGAKIAATTHYAEMKAYALQTPRIENGSCEFNVETLQPTYRLLIGVPGRSNAFAISEKLGIEKSIIDRADELVSSEDHSFESVLRQLDESRLEMEKARKEAQKLRELAQKEKQQIAHLQTQIDKEKEAELERARIQAKAMIEKAKRQASGFLLQLEQMQEASKQQNMDAQRVRRARTQVQKQLYDLDEITASPLQSDHSNETELSGPIEVGDMVRIPSMNTTGIVLAVSGKGKEIQIQAGQLKTRINKNKVKLIAKKQKEVSENTQVYRNITSKQQLRIPQEISLRGKNAEEALLDLDQYLDDAILSGFTEVRIVHGKGTGVLRQAVQGRLRSHPQVKSFRLGKYGEGEDGVTVVTLK